MSLLYKVFLGSFLFLWLATFALANTGGDTENFDIVQKSNRQIIGITDFTFADYSTDSIIGSNFSDFIWKNYIFSQGNQNFRIANVLVPVAPSNKNFDKNIKLTSNDNFKNIKDRYGNLFILPRLNKNYLHHKLLKNGRAIFYPKILMDYNLHACSAQLEYLAYQKKLNIWQNFKIIPQEELIGNYNKITIVRGRIKKIAKVKSLLYINFGEDYHTDFTIKLKVSDIHKWQKLNKLANENNILKNQNFMLGQEIIVTGILQKNNGHMIELKHPAALRMIEKKYHKLAYDKLAHNTQVIEKKLSFIIKIFNGFAWQACQN